MGNVVHPIPGFAGGVSQQSPVMRLDTQCEASVNTHATVADGLMKRPNGDLVKLLTLNASTVGYFTHRIQRDSTEKYIVVIGNNATAPIQVFDLEGNAKTVLYQYQGGNGTWYDTPSAKSYLIDYLTNAKTQLKAVSIADYTIIANTKQTPAMTASASSAAADNAFVWVKRIYTGSYVIVFNCYHSVDGWQNVTLNVANPVGSTWGSADLANQLIASATPSTYLTLSATGNVITAVPRTNVSSVTVARTDDPYGNEALIPISNGAVQKFDDLPPKMPLDCTIKVSGDTKEAQDDYYMHYNLEGKLWYETKGFEVPYAINTATVPHQLVRKSDGTFAFGKCPWEDRTVGDEETSLDPSFIGQPINNLRFHKNRLWFFAGDNAIGSKSGEYFNFFRSTILDVLDDDPIDVAGTGEQVCNIRSAKGFDKGIMLISDEEQFVLTAGDQPFSPKSVSIDSTTEFTADPDVEPVKIGPDVYFLSPKGSYLSLRQYTIMPDTLVQDAYDVTAHVASYIPNGTCMMSGSNLMDMIFLHTSADPSALYVHKFLWDGNNKVQQAWYRWTFDSDIIGFKTFGTVLYVMFDDDTNGTRLEKFNLEIIPLTGQPFRYHLDTLHAVTGGSYSDPDTTFTLSVDVGDGSDWTVIDAADSSELVSGFTLAGSTLTITDADASTKTYYVGRNYEMRHTMSEWYARDGEGRAMITGALQVRELSLAFKLSGDFTVEVTAQGRDTMEAEEMSGIRIGESVLGAVTLLRGEKNFGIMADSKGTTVEIVSDSYLPVSIQMGTWYGTHTMEGTLI